MAAVVGEVAAGRGGRSTVLRYAFLHGFASSPRTRKGTLLASAFRSLRDGAGRPVELRLPDLNQPSFARLTYTDCLAALDRLHQAEVERASLGEGDVLKWCLIGSSMGGYLASRWAELHPERVHKAVLLCPGFDLPSRWPVMFGDVAFRQWREKGFLIMPDSEKVNTPLHYRFIEDSTFNHPTYPSPSCPISIIHGIKDDTVPVETSRVFVKANPQLRKLKEVDDGHDLLASMEVIEKEVIEFFDLHRSSNTQEPSSL